MSYNRKHLLAEYSARRAFYFFFSDGYGQTRGVLNHMFYEIKGEWRL